MTGADPDRPIPAAPGYVITASGEVWSIDRTAAGKSGSVRALHARKLKPDEAGRVSLSINGVVTRASVADIHRDIWPEVVAAQRIDNAVERMVRRTCRNGHPLEPPNVGLWGSGNRVCLICNPGYHEVDGYQQWITELTKMLAD